MIPLRLDDIGACSKQYERWSRHRWANFYPLHDRRLFGAWGPYRELTAEELNLLANTLRDYQASMTLAITACWTDEHGELIPYQERFPHQTTIIAHWAKLGVFEIASHGLTHCVPGQHRPKWIGSNRAQHREPPGS